MTTIGNTFEGGTSGAAITAGTSGGASGDAYTFQSGFNTTNPNTAVFDNARAAHGTLSLKCTYDGTAAAPAGAYLTWNFATSNRLVVRSYVYMQTLPAESFNLMMVYNNLASGNQTGRLSISSSGKLQSLDATGATITGSVATANFPINQWVRIEYAVTVGTTTTNGKGEYAYYLGDSATPVATWSNAAINAGTAPIAQVRLGRTTVPTVVSTVWYDDFRAQDDIVSGWIGAPATATPLVMSSTDRLSYLITAVATPTAGGAMSYAISQTAGTAVTPTSIGTGQWEVTPHPTSAGTYKVTASEVGGSSSSGSVTVPSATSTPAVTTSYEVEMVYFTGAAFV